MNPKGCHEGFRGLLHHATQDTDGQLDNQRVRDAVHDVENVRPGSRRLAIRNIRGHVAIPRPDCGACREPSRQGYCEIRGRGQAVAQPLQIDGVVKERRCRATAAAVRLPLLDAHCR
eukprot:1556587-Pyramimonas_sp.AAC.1